MDADDFMSPIAALTRLGGKCELQLLLLCPEHPDTPTKENVVVLRQYLLLAGLALGMISRHDCVRPLDPLIRHSLYDKKRRYVAKNLLL